MRDLTPDVGFLLVSKCSFRVPFYVRNVFTSLFRVNQQNCLPEGVLFQQPRHEPTIPQTLRFARHEHTNTHAHVMKCVCQLKLSLFPINLQIHGWVGCALSLYAHDFFFNFSGTKYLWFCFSFGQNEMDNFVM